MKSEHERLENIIDKIHNQKLDNINLLYQTGRLINYLKINCVDDEINLETIGLMIEDLHNFVAKTSRICG